MIHLIMRCVYILGHYAYISDYGEGLNIIDISDPTSLSLEGNYDTSEYSYGVHVAGKYAYIADYTRGLVITDIGGIDSEAAYIGVFSQTIFQ